MFLAGQSFRDHINVLAGILWPQDTAPFYTNKWSAWLRFLLKSGKQLAYLDP